jgi:hypothetical protein
MEKILQIINKERQVYNFIFLNKISRMTIFIDRSNRIRLEIWNKEDKLLFIINEDIGDKIVEFLKNEEKYLEVSLT